MLVGQGVDAGGRGTVAFLVGRSDRYFAVRIWLRHVHLRDLPRARGPSECDVARCGRGWCCSLDGVVDW